MSQTSKMLALNSYYDYTFVYYWKTMFKSHSSLVKHFQIVFCNVGKRHRHSDVPFNFKQRVLSDEFKERSSFSD